MPKETGTVEDTASGRAGQTLLERVTEDMENDRIDPENVVHVANMDGEHLDWPAFVDMARGIHPDNHDCLGLVVRYRDGDHIEGHAYVYETQGKEAAYEQGPL